MRKHASLQSYTVVLILILFAAMAQAQAPMQLNADYKLTNRFALPGDGNWDYIALDSGARRLYVSHGDLIQVVDADSGKVVGQVPAPGAHGVALVTELHRGFTSNGGDKSVTVFDTKTLAVIKNLKLESAPDAIVYEPFSKRVFALSEKTTAIDPATNEIVGTLDLGAGPEGAVSDGKGAFYVALARPGTIAVVDPKALSVTKTMPTEPCRSPHTLQYNAADQQLLIGCQSNFIVLDVNSGKVVTASLQCAGVDASGYDPENKLIFESCSEGVVTVIRQMTKSNYRTIATIPTQIWAKTMVFDPATKKIYLPVAGFEFFANPDATKPPDRRWKPGTFTILVASKQ